MIFIFLAWDKGPDVKKIAILVKFCKFFTFFHITGLVKAQKMEIMKNSIQRLYNL